MKQLNLHSLFLFCSAAFAAGAISYCTPKAQPQQSTGQQYLEQDVNKGLTQHPDPPFVNQPAARKPEEPKTAPAQVEFSHEDNARVGEWLDSLQSRNNRIKYANGFRIQVYLGSDRQAAFKAKEAAYRLLKGAEVYLTYTLPTFKVQAGDYMDRLEAEHAFRTIRSRYPDALIVRERISVQR